jgi:hypothetical protein
MNDIGGRMIRTYTVAELEGISGVTRRTIGDYIAKGLLAGPSHRGRGARYPQSDADSLLVVPRLRTLMKKEFANLRAVTGFLKEISNHDLHELARKTNEDAFILAVRYLRVRISLAAVLPQVAPERVTAALAELTPEQVRSIDTGRYALGAVIDMASLLGPAQRDSTAEQVATTNEDSNGSAASSWSVSWLDSNTGLPADIRGINSSQESNSSATAATNGNDLRQPTKNKETPMTTAQELSDISQRVKKLEQLLETE